MRKFFVKNCSALFYLARYAIIVMRADRERRREIFSLKKRVYEEENELLFLDKKPLVLLDNLKCRPPKSPERTHGYRTLVRLDLTRERARAIR
jgi:hypothetical protein